MRHRQCGSRNIGVVMGCARGGFTAAGVFCSTITPNSPFVVRALYKIRYPHSVHRMGSRRRSVWVSPQSVRREGERTRRRKRVCVRCQALEKRWCTLGEAARIATVRLSRSGAGCLRGARGRDRDRERTYHRKCREARRCRTCRPRSSPRPCWRRWKGWASRPRWA